MNLPVRSTGPIETVGPHPSDFASVARALAAQGPVTLVYAPSTTTITNPAPAPAAAPVPVEDRIPGPAAPVATRTASRSGFTLGDVVAYSGATLMGGATLSGLVCALLRVPELVPLLSGIIALLGLVAVLGGTTLDQHERNEGWR